MDEPSQGNRDPVERSAGTAARGADGSAGTAPRVSVNGAARNGSGPAAEEHAHADDESDVVEGESPSDDEGEYEEERARAFLAGGAYATVAIDRYDDLATVFGKIDAAPSPRVALVAARGNRELQRALSMRRLQRHLDLSGKDLILVTRSRALRLRANEEALPAVGSLRRVDFRTYGRGGLRLGWLTLRLPTLGALLAVLLLVGALVAGAAVLFWYLPEGEVTVFLPVQPEEATLDLILDGQTTAVSLEGGVVPSRRREVMVTRSFYRPATGTIQVPNERAAVVLRFTNRTNARLVVPRGTVVVANNGTKFTTSEDLDLPRLNATGDVIALAQLPGTAGNVPVNTAVRIDGDTVPGAAVTNPRPGEKGTDRPEQVVSEADVEGVRAFAEPVLIDAASQELRVRLAEAATVFEPSATIEITEVRSIPPAGQPAKFADVRVTGRASLLTVDDRDLRAVYVNHFRPLIPAERMLLEDAFITSVLRTGALDRAQDRLPVTVQVRAQTAPYLDRDTLRAALAGKSKPGAAVVIAGLVPDAPAPQVKISPGWAPRLPRKTDRIDVVFAPAPP